MISYYIFTGNLMKDDSHHFTKEDLDNIDELIYYLKELVC